MITTIILEVKVQWNFLIKELFEFMCVEMKLPFSLLIVSLKSTKNKSRKKRKRDCFPAKFIVAFKTI